MENSSRVLEILPSDMISAIVVPLDLATTSSFLRTCKQLYCASKQLPQEAGEMCGVDRLLQQSAEKCMSLSKVEYSTVFSHCVKNNKISLLQCLIAHESDDNKSLRIRLLEASHCDQSCYNDVACNLKAYNDSIKSDSNSVDLYAAVKDNNFIVVNALLREGVAVESVINGEEITPLCVASMNGYADILKLLLAYGANVEGLDEDGDTSLILASTYGYTELVKSLLAHGALVNSTGFCGATALLRAVCGGKIETVRVLLENGADKAMCVGHDDFFQWINQKVTYSKEILELLNTYR